MKAIEYVVRDGAGVLQRGTLIESGISDNLTLGGADGAVSLNLRRASIREYLRAGGENLEMYLADGRKIVLEGGFYAENGVQENRLYLNEDGALIEASLDANGHVTFTQAGEWGGKWSHLDALIFPPDDATVVAEAVVETGVTNEVASQGIGLGLGGLGGAGLGLGPLVGGAGVIGGLTGGGGGGGGHCGRCRCRAENWRCRR